MITRRHKTPVWLLQVKKSISLKLHDENFYKIKKRARLHLDVIRPQVGDQTRPSQRRKKQVARSFWKEKWLICTMREAQLGNFLEADLCTLMTNKLFNENNKTNINSVQIRNLCFIMLKLWQVDLMKLVLTA